MGSHAQATDKCKALQEDDDFFQACVYDYCASEGDESFVENAMESKTRQVARAKMWGSPNVSSASLMSTNTPTLSSTKMAPTTTQNSGTPIELSSASIVAPFTMWIALVSAGSLSLI